MKVLLFLLVLIPAGVVAQGLSLDDALENARNNYPSLRGKFSAIRAAESDAQALRMSFLPQAGVQTQALNATSNQVRGAYVSNGGLALPIAGVRTDGFNSQAAWTSFGSVVIDWEAVTFGRRQARKNQARLAIEQSQVDYDVELFTHQVRVCDAFLLALNARKSVELQQANLQRAEALQTIIRAGTAGGLRPGIDSSVSNAEVARARLLLLESRKNAQQLTLRLTELIGKPDPSARIDSMHFYDRLPEAAPAPNQALTIHPLLRSYHKQLEVAEASRATLKASALPSVSLIGSLEGRGSGISEQAGTDGKFDINPSLGSGLPFRAYNYIVGVTALWRPTELFRTRYALSSQKERANVSRQAYNQQVLTLEANGQNAALQLELAQATVRQSPLQLDAARQAYNQSRARYESGLDNILTLTQTATLLNRAEVDQALAVNNLWRAFLLKAAAAGDLQEFLKQVR
jgi:outer membrane protein TolC